MRLDRGWVLRRVWPHRDVGKAKPRQQSADATLGQLDAEAGLDHPRQVRSPPANDTVLAQIRTGADEAGHFGLLLRRQARLGPGALRSDKPARPSSL